MVSNVVAGGDEDNNKSSIKVRYVIENAGNASFATAYHGYSTFVTTQSTPFLPDSWTRTCDTSVSNDGSLTWTHVHGNNGSNGAYFAYFPPYSYERHLGLIARCGEAGAKSSGLCSVQTLGQTLMGREIDCVTVGTGLLTCWIICRQHPGETMASFYVEGLLNRLLGLDDEDENSGPINDEVVKRAIDMFTFHIVPNVNPDGSAAGYLRTNAAGSNLNREWATVRDDYIAPTLDKSPEVLYILRQMDKTGVDAFLDIHGDEALPFNFLSGSEGMSVWGPRLKALHGAFLASYERTNTDMQGRVSYDPDEPGEGMHNICSNSIAERFDCFSGTLEMPFKELINNKNELGWGPERARRLGASVLEPLCYVGPNLRVKSEFWEGLSEEDAYVKPSSKYETLA
jgi:murein tripeptide amidase MpaA